MGKKDLQQGWITCWHCIHHCHIFPSYFIFFSFPYMLFVILYSVREYSLRHSLSEVRICLTFQHLRLKRCLRDHSFLYLIVKQGYSFLYCIEKMLIWHMKINDSIWIKHIYKLKILGSQLFPLIVTWQLFLEVSHFPKMKEHHYFASIQNLL